mmetsp:Transcript_18346/g.40539  ORF Transcript_18346/g.40539 Transcript_18346/m.40539 type:complete len:212 (-) Transcript_18346:2040-2675(-)
MRPWGLRAVTRRRRLTLLRLQLLHLRVQSSQLPPLLHQPITDSFARGTQGTGRPRRQDRRAGSGRKALFRQRRRLRDGGPASVARPCLQDPSQLVPLPHSGRNLEQRIRTRKPRHGLSPHSCQHLPHSPAQNPSAHEPHHRRCRQLPRRHCLRHSHCDLAARPVWPVHHSPTQHPGALQRRLPLAVGRLLPILHCQRSPQDALEAQVGGLA